MQDGNKNFRNAELLVKYRKAIINYINRIYTFSGATDNLDYELKSAEKITDIPVGFADFNRGLLSYQSRIYYDKVLNTVKLTADERATLIAKEGAIPSLSNFQPLLDIPEIEYFGVVYCYIAKDFTSNEVINADGETIIVVILKETLKKLINLEITPEEANSTSTFYNSNKNTGGTLRKINIKP